jgi:hypothetical protein
LCLTDLYFAIDILIFCYFGILLLILMLRRVARALGQGPTTCLYRVLGLAPGSELAMVKTAYYALAQKLHPDRNPSESAR